MSNSKSVSGDFWAKFKKPPAVDFTPDSPAVAQDGPVEPMPVEAITAKTPGMLFRPRKENIDIDRSNTATSFGSSMLSLNTHKVSLSWADSMEESEELLILGQEQDSSMADVVAQHVKRAPEAEVHISQQGKLIAKLEDDIRGKTVRIQGLENMLDSSGQHLKELEAVNQEQAIRISLLIDETIDKERSILQLQKDLAAACATLQNLELQVSENNRIPRSDSSTEIGESYEEDAGHECEPVAVPVPIVLETAPAKSESKDVEKDNDHTLHDVQDTTAGAAQAASGSDIYAIALSPVDFPALGPSKTAHGLPRTVFVTPETLKKVPPPPPARKLTLGIDPSKFLKKTDTKRRMALVPRREDAEPPMIDPTKDIRRMTKVEREPYGWGPSVKIVLGTQDVVVLPKYIFMQVSPKALKHWKENPNADSMIFPSGAFTKKALDIQWEWMTAHTQCNKVFSVTLKQDGNDRHNLELVRCARALGLDSMYMGHFTRKYCEQIRDGPSPDLVALVEELAWDETDPIFECLAHNWVLQYAKAKSEDAKLLDKNLARFPRLSAKVNDIQVRKKFALGGAGRKGQAMVKPIID